MKRLTKAEEEIMLILWDIGEGFVNDILKKIAAPKPAYNTVSTIVRILERKEFVGYRSFGKSHQYYPIVDKKAYTGQYLKFIIKDYFQGSFKEMVSFLAKEDNLSISELDELTKQIQDIKTKKK